MIHYIYTGELADGWQDLDIQDVTIAADMYDLPGWIELFPSTQLTRSEKELELELRLTLDPSPSLTVSHLTVQVELTGWLATALQERVRGEEVRA